MAKPVIEIHEISKKFRLGSRTPDLRQAMTKMFSFKKQKWPEIWALRDVSFSVNEGEVLGLIGPNGSGKSTLLKILSRITYPTSGRAILRGRVSSLLEVGTGFHNELTGRENIYLNGSILGMKRHEIRQKFDEIVGFSGVKQFIDTPVKHYSSGMYVRLAFSVAAHLEPEILLVDEVLSVGDLAFRQKSMGKMEEVAKQGRTVIFVSHNLDAIQSLCPNSLYLDSGYLISAGLSKNVIGEYKNRSGIVYEIGEDEPENQDLKVAKFEIYDSVGNNTTLISSGDDIKIDIEVASNIYLERFVLSILFKDIVGNELAECNNYLTGNKFELIIGINKFSVYLYKIPLNKGRFLLDLNISHRGKEIFAVKNIKKIEIIEGSFFPTNFFPDPMHSFLIDHRWVRNK